MTRSGHGELNTDKFFLAGDYRIDWTATAPADASAGCYHAVHLRPGFAAADVGAILNGPNERQSGTTHVYELDPGMYYLQAISGCDWTESLTPE